MIDPATNDAAADSLVVARRQYRNFLLATPFFPLVAVLFALLPSIWNVQLIWGSVALGAAGWWVAFLLRAPVALITKRLIESTDTLQRVVALASGPTEELVRLAALAIVGTNFDIAYSVGLGWSGIEIAFTILNGFMMARIVLRTDEEAVKARKLLQDLGLLTESGAGPFLGILERIWATGAHIGFTLLLAVQPLFVLISIPLHSSFNYIVAFILMRRSVAAAQVLIAIFGVTLFTLGLAAFGLL